MITLIAAIITRFLQVLALVTPFAIALFVVVLIVAECQLSKPKPKKPQYHYEMV